MSLHEVAGEGEGTGPGEGARDEFTHSPTHSHTYTQRARTSFFFFDWSSRSNLCGSTSGSSSSGFMSFSRRISILRITSPVCRSSFFSRSMCFRTCSRVRPSSSGELFMRFSCIDSTCERVDIICPSSAATSALIKRALSSFNMCLPASPSAMVAICSSIDRTSFSRTALRRSSSKIRFQ